VIILNLFFKSAIAQRIIKNSPSYDTRLAQRLDPVTWESSLFPERKICKPPGTKSDATTAKPINRADHGSNMGAAISIGRHLRNWNYLIIISKSINVRHTPL
jgi:hypothetical protein